MVCNEKSHKSLEILYKNGSAVVLNLESTSEKVFKRIHNALKKDENIENIKVIEKKPQVGSLNMDSPSSIGHVTRNIRQNSKELVNYPSLSSIESFALGIISPHNRTYCKDELSKRSVKREKMGHLNAVEHDMNDIFFNVMDWDMSDFRSIQTFIKNYYDDENSVVFLGLNGDGQFPTEDEYPTEQLISDVSVMFKRQGLN